MEEYILVSIEGFSLTVCIDLECMQSLYDTSSNFIFLLTKYSTSSYKTILLLN